MRLLRQPRPGLIGAARLPFFRAAALDRRLNVVAFWNLASDSLDKSGGGHDGTDTSVTYDGSQATYTGTGKTAISVISVGTTFTWSAWVNLNDISTGSYRTIITNAASDFGIFARRPTGTTVKLNFFYSGADHLSSAVFAATTLTHVAVVCSAGAVTLYFNGVASGTYSSAVAGTLSQIGNDPFSDRLAGKLRCAGLFSDAKDAAWVTSVYNGGTPLPWASM